MPKINVRLRSFRRWWQAPPSPRPSPCRRSLRAGGGGRQRFADHGQRHRSAHQTDLHIDPQGPHAQEVIQELIDDRIKIAKAKSYGFEVPDTEVDQAFANMARNQHMSPQQFTQVIERACIRQHDQGAYPRRADLDVLVRGKNSSSLEVGDSDVARVLRRPQRYPRRPGRLHLHALSGHERSDSAGRTRRPSRQSVARRTICAAASSPAPRAWPCRARCATSRCANRSPAVRPDLPPQLREVLASIEVGHLTNPEVTEQGLQMFALCNKKESKTNSRSNSRCARSYLPKNTTLRPSDTSTKSANRR